METGIRILLLTAALALLPGCASLRGWLHRGTQSPQPAPEPPVAADRESPPRVIEPQVERRTIKVPRIKSSNVELGL
ncbi:MAG TPA: hypothetical protein VKQ31_00850, partial [Steroidobacteraceae bacterium]|nr:hypothetical protein [Steroidobacteraceae bacterium]